jgi:uncharacterized membrane protein
MRTAQRGVRKLVLLFHVTCSVGWFGAVLAFIPLAVAVVNSAEDDLARGAYLAADLLLRFVIVPLALASVVTGVLSSLVSARGLVRHYWVIAKLVLTVAATVVLLLQIEPIGAAAERTAAPEGGPLPEAAGLSMLVHAIGGVVVLLAVTALAVYKPRGTTRFAARSARGGSRQSAVRR